ncbi:MAG: electron transfer flavoprotein subunit alpha/FixB family protein [Bacteroidetes bacterium]|jgi:electron transfer flavoprotein alpha subunit|nr:electron transfer flavoprotein subunit alpha/FixB family protein [Bacteroidota bacterium]
MSVLVYTESDQGKFKKIAFEAVSYAKGIADKMGTSVTAVAFNVSDTSELAKYGASKVLEINDEKLNKFNGEAFADVLAQAAKKEDAKIIVLTSSANSKYMAPTLAIDLEAGYVPNVVELPETGDAFTVKHSVFSNKAFANTEIKTPVKIIGIGKNSYGLRENETALSTENFTPNLDSHNFDVDVVSVEKSTDTVSIADAEIVVSGGRGLKGPENWGMIEDLAKALGAATACSKPVSDMGWRPHEEHVGQTGKPVASNLYIAVGISGAIQHLAGINASKVKVVINNDPEAPFFKAADYGMVGDAFEIVPKLTEKIKEFKAQNG